MSKRAIEFLFSYLVADVLSHVFAFGLHFAVFLLAAIFGLLDGLQTLTLGLIVFVFGVTIFAIISSQTYERKIRIYSNSK